MYADLAEVCCLSAYYLGHFSLALDLTKRFYHLTKKLLEDRRDLFDGQKRYTSSGLPNILNDRLETSRTFPLIIDALSCLYREDDLQSSLMKFMAALSKSSLTPRVSTLQTFPLCFDYVVCLCAFLGDERSGETYARLQDISKHVVSETKLKAAFLNCAVTVNSLISCSKEFANLRSSYRFRIETKNALSENDFEKAWKAAVKSWQGFSCISVPRAFSYNQQQRFRDVLFSVILHLSADLKKLNCAKGQHEAAERFLKFRFTWAKERKMYFLAALLEIEFVHFLKDRERFSEALEQCRLVETGLREHFGDDYLTWLSNAPNTALLNQSISAKKHSQKPNADTNGRHIPLQGRISHARNLSLCADKSYRK